MSNLITAQRPMWPPTGCASEATTGGDPHACVFVLRGGPPRTAFTLVELLVVLAVIGIFAALLLPTLSRAKDAALSTACRGNLRQIGIGLQLYTHEFSAYPRYAVIEPGSMDVLFWYDHLQPYTVPWPKSGNPRTNMPAGLYNCPSFTRLVSLFPPGSYTYWGFFRYNSSYAFNVFGTSVDDRLQPALGLGGQRLAPDVGFYRDLIRPITEREVLQPSDMMASGDGWLNRYPFDSDKIYADPMFDEPLYHSAFVLRHPAVGLPLQQKHHRGRFNVLFCDGHIESTKGELLYAWQDDRLKRWNNDHRPHRETLPGGARP